jgi:ribonuclease E
MPPTDSDDDWAELARELARDQPKPSTAEHTPEPPRFEEVEPPNEFAAMPEGDGGPELGPDGAPEPETAPGPGRKRRRRRRRRRKGAAGPDTELQTVDGAEDAAGEAEDAEDDEIESSEESTDLEFDPVAVESDSDEYSGEELLRDLIANWNVPSWDDVVAGLYRPER